MKTGHSHPLIALLTDFGLRDNFSGVMKGVILRDCPTATFVDITHSVPPQSILHASLCLRGAYLYFPSETIFVAVVDPGVGTSRGIIAVSGHAMTFVAPDNGLLWPLVEAMPGSEMWEITWRPECKVGATFHGRDIFAPVAAKLASGAALSDIGEQVETIKRFEIPSPVCEDWEIGGEVIYIDNFGNLTTNVSRSLLEEKFSREYLEALCVKIGTEEICGLPGTYAEVPVGDAAMVFNSFDMLEIAVNCGNAARRFDAVMGTKIFVSLNNRSESCE